MSIKKKLIVFIPLILILGFIVFKSWALFYYRIPSYSSDYSLIKISDDEKSIKTDKSLANTKFKTLNIYIPDSMVKEEKEEEIDFVVSYANKEDIDSESKVKNLNISTSFGCDDFNYDPDARAIDGVKIMQKNNFKNKFDVIKYYMKNLNKKSTIFSSYEDIKLNYFLNYCSTSPSLSTAMDYYYLNGDIDGLYGTAIRETSYYDSYSIDVYDDKNNKYYHIYMSEKKDAYDEFPGEDKYNLIFTEDMREKILSSIYFD